MTTVLQTLISPADYMQVCAWQPSPYIPISYRFSTGHFRPIIITYRIDYQSIICHDDRPDPALKMHTDVLMRKEGRLKTNFSRPPVILYIPRT